MHKFAALFQQTVSTELIFWCDLFIPRTEVTKRWHLTPALMTQSLGTRSQIDHRRHGAMRRHNERWRQPSPNWTALLRTTLTPVSGNDCAAIAEERLNLKWTWVVIMSTAHCLSDWVVAAITVVTDILLLIYRNWPVICWIVNVYYIEMWHLMLGDCDGVGWGTGRACGWCKRSHSNSSGRPGLVAYPGVAAKNRHWK